MKQIAWIICITSLLLLAACARGSNASDPDPELLAAIQNIKAIDNHAHPSRLTLPGDKEDDEWDALPFEGYEAYSPPVRLRLDNPEFAEAWRALYGVSLSGSPADHLKEIMPRKIEVMRQHGENYPAWVLDQLGIDVMFANRVKMGTGLKPPRFRWVPYADAFLFPLSTQNIAKEHANYSVFYEAEKTLLHQYLAEAKVSALPLTLDQYVEQVVKVVIRQQKAEGAVALKFEAAYLRPLAFHPADQTRASAAYARFIKGGAPSGAEYEAVQDYIFFEIAREAGNLGLPLHFHTGAGAGAQYELRGSDPSLLGEAADRLRKTNFVFVHGGWPFTKEVAYLFNKPNVYADFSAQTFLLYPRALSQVLRDWMEWYPEKIMFGTDAAPFDPAANWEETGWVAAKTARTALAMALTDMMRGGEITRERAIELARMVLRDNAAKLYGFAGK